MSSERAAWPSNLRLDATEDDKDDAQMLPSELLPCYWSAFLVVWMSARTNALRPWLLLSLSLELSRCTFIVALWSPNDIEDTDVLTFSTFPNSSENDSSSNRCWFCCRSSSAFWWCRRDVVFFMSWLCRSSCSCCCWVITTVCCSWWFELASWFNCCIKTSVGHPHIKSATFTSNDLESKSR